MCHRNVILIANVSSVKPKNMFKVNAEGCPTNYVVVQFRTEVCCVVVNIYHDLSALPLFSDICVSQEITLEGFRGDPHVFLSFIHSSCPPVKIRCLTGG